MSKARRDRLALPIVLFLLAAGCGTGQGQHVQVLFEDTDGLEAGDPVRYQGFEVGTVEGLEPVPGNVTRVSVSVREEHGDLLREGLRFRIEEDETGGDPGGKILAMSVPDPDAPALPDSATVLGRGDDWRAVLDRLEEIDWEELADTARRELEGLLERAREAARSLREEGG